MRITLFLIAVLAWAQPALEAPLAGYLRESEGVYRPVWGFAGNFVLGPIQAQAPAEPVWPERIEQRDALFYVVRGDGATMELLPPGVTTAMRVRGGLVYATGDDLVLRRADASERRWELRGVMTLRAMSEEYLQVSVPGAELALRIAEGQEGLYRLPSAPRQERRR